MRKRVFIIVLDSCGIGYMPDAVQFGDEGADTMRSIAKSEKFFSMAGWNDNMERPAYALPDKSIVRDLSMTLYLWVAHYLMWGNNCHLFVSKTNY